MLFLVPGKNVLQYLVDTPSSYLGYHKDQMLVHLLVNIFGNNEKTYFCYYVHLTFALDHISRN